MDFSVSSRLPRARRADALTYFLDEAAMHEGNPQELLERAEQQALPRY